MTGFRVPIEHPCLQPLTTRRKYSPQSTDEYLLDENLAAPKSKPGGSKKMYHGGLLAIRSFFALSDGIMAYRSLVCARTLRIMYINVLFPALKQIITL